MPLGLVSWEHFGLTYGLVRCNLDAGGKRVSAHRADMSLRDVTIVRDETGWQGAGDVTHRKRTEVCVRIWRKLESWVLDAKRRGSTFGARRREANLRPMGAARDGGQMKRTAQQDCLSSLCRNFNSKLIKRFRTWTRSRYVFSNFEIPMFFICSIVMNIICLFRTWR